MIYIYILHSLQGLHLTLCSLYMVLYPYISQFEQMIFQLATMNFQPDLAVIFPPQDGTAVQQLKTINYTTTPSKNGVKLNMLACTANIPFRSSLKKHPSMLCFVFLQKDYKHVRELRWGAVRCWCLCLLFSLSLSLYDSLNFEFCFQ